MSQITLDQAFQIALGHHQAGQLPQAESIYRQILGVNAQHSDALHLLGVLQHQMGNHAGAIELIRQAIVLVPNNAAYHSNLGVAYMSLERLQEALACQQKAIELQPNFPEALGNLGLLLHRLGRTAEALDPLHKAIALRPTHHDAHRFLGDALFDLGRIDDAMATYRRAIALDPAHSTAYHNLAVTLAKLERIEESIATYRLATAATPNDGTSWQNLAVLLLGIGKNREAFEAYQMALKLLPQSADIWCGIGHSLKNGGRPDDAIEGYRKAIEIDPRHALAQANLGCALRDRGEIAEAVAALRRALAMMPTSDEIHSNLIITLYLSGRTRPEELAAEKQRWDQHFVQPLAGQIKPHANDRSPERRLRIGYVSPDFREHPVGRLMLRLLQHHDKTQSEIFCYSNSLQVDAFTEQLRQQADQWRSISGLKDAQLAEQIRADRIDILVDLAMHTINSRLMVFARKPAPLQISYLAYPDGTGASTVDYRLTDPYLDPPSESDQASFERPLRLPDSYWCYAPAIETPAVNELPALTAGHITFGALNDFCKITPEALETWAELLNRLPTARLLLHAPAGSPHDRAAAFFSAKGISLARIEFITRLPIAQYFAMYQRIDIALAGFPYAGGTTMSDALWMGVPPMTLAGDTSISRAGLSVLSNVGLPDLVARTREEYITIAVALAQDLPRLAALRRTLRERLQQSPLGNAPQFVRALESAYRQIWRTWCQQPHKVRP